MTIQVDVRPEVEAELSRQAAARGRALEEHAARLLEEALKVEPHADSAPSNKTSVNYSVDAALLKYQ